MSLNWNATKVANIDERLKDEEQSHLISHFAFVLMGIHISSVSEKNVGEVWTRIQLWEKFNGPFLYNKADKSALTWEFVQSLIGYGTNVSNTPLGKWSADLLKREAQRFQGYYETDKQKELADA